MCEKRQSNLVRDSRGLTSALWRIVQLWIAGWFLYHFDSDPKCIIMFVWDVVAFVKLGIILRGKGQIHLLQLITGKVDLHAREESILLCYY